MVEEPQAVGASEITLSRAHPSAFTEGKRLFFRQPFKQHRLASWDAAKDKTVEFRSAGYLL